MSEINLTAADKSALEKKHKKNRNSKESDRIKAILLRSEGWTIPMISQALRIHESSVGRHIDDYNRGKLSIASGGSISALDGNQTKKLIAHLEFCTYQNTKEIIDYVKNKYAISYSIPGINKWLHRNGFSYKKPKGYPHKADKAKQKEFIKKYEKLKNSIKPEESIIFMDSCHPSMATKITHGWIKKGKDKPIETTASRTRINLVGAIELGKISKTVVADYCTINSESIVNFMGVLRKKSKSSEVIHLILDGAGYHRSDLVSKESKNLNIKLHFLPPYSPNLNPIERLWKIMNEMVRNNRFFKTPSEFRESISYFYKKTLPKIGNTLDDRINDNFQKLNYAF